MTSNPYEKHTGRRQIVSPSSAAPSGLRALAPDALEVHGGDPADRARDGVEDGEHVGVLPARDMEAADHQADQHGPDERPDERPHDPAPEPVREEDREMPDRQAHHGPAEHAHQRFLPWRRL